MLEILGENRERERNFQYTEHGKEPLENSNEKILMNHMN